MKKLLLILMMIGCMPALADYSSDAYIGAAAVHAKIDNQNADGARLYGGWSLSEPGRKDSYRIEMQAEQYKTDLLDVGIVGIHALGTVLYISGGGNIYIDIGVSGAQFEAIGQTESKGFFSLGLGYRQAIGPVSIHAGYLVDNITEVGGIEIERPQRADIGIDYKF